MPCLMDRQQTTAALTTNPAGAHPYFDLANPALGLTGISAAGLLHRQDPITTINNNASLFSQKDLQRSAAGT